VRALVEEAVAAADVETFKALLASVDPADWIDVQSELSLRLGAPIAPEYAPDRQATLIALAAEHGSRRRPPALEAQSRSREPHGPAGRLSAPGASVPDHPRNRPRKRRLQPLHELGALLALHLLQRSDEVGDQRGGQLRPPQHSASIRLARAMGGRMSVPLACASSLDRTASTLVRRSTGRTAKRPGSRQAGPRAAMLRPARANDPAGLFCETTGSTEDRPAQCARRSDR
jgi:hypothetical protein